MARSHYVQNSLAGGEIDPLLDAAADLDWYAASALMLKNMIVLPTRGANRRGGTRYIAAAKTAANRTAGIGFVFNADQAYAIEVGDQYLRFYKDRGRIEVANTDAAIANGTMTGSLASWTDLDAGAGASAHDATNNRMSLTPGGTTAADIAWREQAVSVGASYQAVSHVLRFRVIGAPGDYVQCRIGTSTGAAQLIADRKCRVGWHSVSFTPGAATVYVQFRNQGSDNNDFSSLNKNIQVDDVSLIDNAPLEIASPYLQADLFDDIGRLRIKYTQSNDVLYLTHPDYPPYKLSRSGHTDWALTAMAFDEGPFLDENTGSTQVQVSAVTGAAVTLTATATKGINNGQGFLATDVGRLVRAKVGTDPYGWGIIVGRTDSLNVTVDVRSTFTTGTTNTSKWALGLYSDTDGWPTNSMFYEERHKFAGSDGRPNRFDGSASGDFENFTPGTADADAVAFTIASDQSNPIVWMAPLNKLLIGTADEMADMMPVLPGGGGGFAASGPSNGVITPTTVEVKKQSADVALYVQRHGREIREVAFSWESEGYKSEPMSIRAQHLTRGGIVAMAWQNKPFGILWAARADGLLLGFTYQRAQKLTAWHQHPLGGNGLVESIVCIPGDDHDEVWLLVRRTINSATVRYWEILEPPLDDETADQVECFYVDCGLTLDGAQAATLTPGAGATTAGTTGVTFTAGSAVFSGTSADVGREIRYRLAADEGAYPPRPTAIEARATITGAVDTTHVIATIVGAFPTLDPIASGAWRLSFAGATGLDHLEGETVQILADGAPHDPQVVTSGAITFDYPVTIAQIGLQFKSRLLPVKWQPPTREGPSLGKIASVSDVTLRVYRSMGCRIGPDEAGLYDVNFRDAGDAMDLALPLFTGDKKTDYGGDYGTYTSILIGQDEPLPLCILSISAVLVMAEGG